MTTSFVGKNCPYCQTPIKPGVDIVICPACQMPHHRDCWMENHGCTTFGCQQRTHTPPPQPQQPVAPPPGYPGAPMPPPGYPRGAMPPPPATYGNPYGMGQYPYTGVRVPCKEADEALTYAIIGIFICGIVLEPLAIVKALRARDMIRMNPNLTGDGKAVAALIIAGIALALSALLILGSILSNQ